MAESGRKQDFYLKKKKKKSPFLSILLHYVLPYLILNSCILFFVLATPKLQVNDPTEHGDKNALAVLVHVDSVLPIKNFSAKLEGEELNFTKENQNYLIPVSSNGNLRISVTSINGMQKVVNSQINSFDENPPVIDEDHVVLGSGYVEFTVSDTQSGVDFASIYGIDKDGDNIKPKNIDENTGTVQFSMKTNGITVYVSDNAGNQVSGNFNLEDSPYPKTKADLEEESSDDKKETASKKGSDSDKNSSKTESSSEKKILQEEKLEPAAFPAIPVHYEIKVLIS
ncbi:hypothetical protein HMPREF9624_00640 [Oribacterium asaccharolyticum ACB7]|uniref:Uncharacterized protein n=1 Tax=Oribacterium asaccharolyticum ACB7 TaxID=796944 RepID=G9WUD0_9FIRM|nr:hypothetical protein [Oribacterium asaccharolyticum]EHL12333.1 hypothetical protein HMPREF9624_00640 [Oribacterium asaccharolyticum ACB7]